MPFLLLLLALVIVIAPFISRKLSPIPYFPSNKKDLPLILKALNLRNGQTIIDLGAGDGVVVFEAARHSYELKLSTKFIAVEINPILFLILHIRRFFHPNRKNIEIVYGDMFKLDFAMWRKDKVTVFLYISPWFMERVYKKIKKDLKRFDLVTYFYQVPKVRVKKEIGVKNKIFLY